jgi:uncharacterized protein (DUF427 family)
MGEHTVRIERGQRRIRGYLAGRLVVDTIHPRLVWEHPYYPTYYLPAEDVRAELVANGKTTQSVQLGDGVGYDVQVDGGSAPAAALRYPDSPFEELRALVRFDWPAMDEWLEEDEPVFGHPRDPYTRVDILASSRHVLVRVAGVTVAESDQPRILFETGHPPRYYLPRTAMNRELLRPSPTRTQCPYKGTAEYWHVVVDGQQYDDLVWTYPNPLPESQKAAGLVCFYTEKVELLVDGERA